MVRRKHTETKICNDSFDLMELCKMGSIDCLISEHTIDREVPRWSWVLGETVKAWYMIRRITTLFLG